MYEHVSVEASPLDSRGGGEGACCRREEGQRMVLCADEWQLNLDLGTVLGSFEICNFPTRREYNCYGIIAEFFF